MPSTPTKGAHAKPNATHCWELGYSSLLCAKENNGEKVMAKGIEKMYQTNGAHSTLGTSIYNFGVYIMYLVFCPFSLTNNGCSLHTLLH